ncbi:MAG TPA: response regulator [Planctomycetota bacterium]|nr:response regulator [Planctomycetota bacterium]
MDEQDPLVYVVHGDSDVLLALYDVLSAAGFRVAASSNARDALAYVARSRPRAVLCHWEMPEMEGGELLARLRNGSPESRIIMSSRKADSALYDDVLAKGGDDLLREPLSEIAVVHAVSRMLGFSIPYPHLDSPTFRRQHSGLRSTGTR